jgi:cysteine desulfurase/selenocysteine lyase
MTWAVEAGRAHGKGAAGEGPPGAPARRAWSAESIRAEFPILATRVRGRPLVYLDSAATSQKPLAVIEAMDRYYRSSNANIHRGIHFLAERATAEYESARERVRRHIGAPSCDEVVFTRGTTESINLVRYAWGRKSVREGDEILLTQMEHHSNIVPWQLLAKETGARVVYAPITPEGLLDLEAWERLLGSGRVKLAAFVHVSNVLGTINPVAEMCAKARALGVATLVDGAQAAPHMPVDVAAIGCDFYAFSGHKMAGPTGVGVLYGRREVLERMDPFLGGGEMIATVTFEGSTWNELPWRFEAGTMNIAEAIGLGAAVDWLAALGLDEVRAHERRIAAHALRRVAEAGGRVYGPLDPDRRGGVVAFTVPEVHPHDLAQVLDQDGIAIRAGHHCAQPLAGVLGVAATARASFFVHTTEAEVDALADAIVRARAFFS